jgi:hypothetical protein
MIRKLVDYEFERIYGGDVLTYLRYYPVVCLEVIYKTIKKTVPGYAHTDTNLKFYTL